MTTKRKANEIRAWLKRRGVTVRSIARDLGKSESLIHNCLVGRNNNRRVLAKLVDMRCPARFLALPDDMQRAA